MGHVAVCAAMCSTNHYSHFMSSISKREVTSDEAQASSCYAHTQHTVHHCETIAKDERKLKKKIKMKKGENIDGETEMRDFLFCFLSLVLEIYNFYFNIFQDISVVLLMYGINFKVFRVQARLHFLNGKFD